MPDCWIPKLYFFCLFIFSYFFFMLKSIGWKPKRYFSLYWIYIKASKNCDFSTKPGVTVTGLIKIWPGRGRRKILWILHEVSLLNLLPFLISGLQVLLCLSVPPFCYLREEDPKRKGINMESLTRWLQFVSTLEGVYHRTASCLSQRVRKFEYVTVQLYEPNTNVKGK